MTKAIQCFSNGGPEVMEYVDVQVGEPGAGDEADIVATIGELPRDCKQRRDVAVHRHGGDDDGRHFAPPDFWIQCANIRYYAT